MAKPEIRSESDAFRAAFHERMHANNMYGLWELASQMTGQPMPKLKWSFSDIGNAQQLKIQSDTAVSKLQLWTASAPTMDFRDAPWTTTGDTMNGKEFSLNLQPKSSVNTAYFAELKPAK